MLQCFPDHQYFDYQNIIVFLFSNTSLILLYFGIICFESEMALNSNDKTKKCHVTNTANLIQLRELTAEKFEARQIRKSIIQNFELSWRIFSRHLDNQESTVTTPSMVSPWHYTLQQILITQGGGGRDALKNYMVLNFTLFFHHFVHKIICGLKTKFVMQIVVKL